MSAQEFVVFNADGREIDWVDPYVGHIETGPRLYLVDNGHYEYDMTVPKGGWFEIRERAS
ncbi:hypothetical protein [Tsukamurella sp. NPDC003166]|uniref:hypothetical protein n=1 Tax=Tsukamurella sp. NPDC003166 TaxID=3154444 RepID=UPI0033AF875B